MKHLYFIVVALACAGVVFAGDDGDAARRNNEANRLYREGRLEEALGKYGEAVFANPDSPALRYNMGNALFRLGRFDEAGGEFGAAAGKPSPKSGDAADVALDALYNQGSTLLQAEDYKGAAEVLREVLLRAPGDDDARRNLEVALARLMKQQQQQEQEQDQNPHEQDEPGDQQQDQGESGDNTDQPRPDEQDPSDPSDPATPDDQPSDAQPDPSAGSEPQEGEQDAEPEAGEEKEIGEEEARRLLEALSQDERSELKESLDRRPRNKGKPERDW